MLLKSFLILVCFCEVVLFSVMALADECPVIRIAQKSFSPDEVSNIVEEGVVLVDPKLIEQYPDFVQVLRKACETLNTQSWKKHQEQADIAKRAMNDGGVYYGWADPNVPLKDKIRKDWKLDSTIGGITPDDDFIQITGVAGATDTELARVIVHETTHLGKVRECTTFDKVKSASKLAVVGAGVLGTVGVVFGIPFKAPGIIAGGTLATGVGAIAGGIGGYGLACRDETDPTNVDKDMPDDLFDGKVRWQYPTTKVLVNEHGIDRKEVQDKLEKKETEPVILNGKVTNKDNGQPIAGASVSATGDFSSSASTDGGGGFSFSGLELNTQIHVTVSAKGFESFFKRARLISPNAFLSFALAPSEEEEAQEATLVGTVVDKDSGATIPGAIVSVFDEFGSIGYERTTQADGSFSVPNLWLGKNVRVSALADGYKASAKLTLTMTFQETGVTLALSRKIDSLDLRWNPPNPDPRENVVVTATITPRIPGIPIRITVDGTDNYHDVQVLLTDANGRVSLFVPGASQGTKDTIKAELVGQDLENINDNDKYVF